MGANLQQFMLDSPWSGKEVFQQIQTEAKSVGSFSRANVRQLFKAVLPLKQLSPSQVSGNSPVKVKLIKPESHAQASLMDNENFKVGCTIV